MNFEKPDYQDINIAYLVRNYTADDNVPLESVTGLIDNVLDLPKKVYKIRMESSRRTGCILFF